MPSPIPFWPADGGPIYAETPAHIHEGQWLIEPWNAISSLLILLPSIYFLYQLRGQFRQQAVLALCAPLLILGGLGSTLFHGLRMHKAFLLMDFMPTLAAFLVMIAYLWFRALKSWWLALGVLALVFGLSYWAHTSLPPSSRTNVSYFIRGTAFFMPLIILLLRTRFQKAAWLLAGLAGLVAALIFRMYDKSAVDILPMGSHFLWHANTGFGGLCIAHYMISLGNPPQQPHINNPYS